MHKKHPLRFSAPVYSLIAVLGVSASVCPLLAHHSVAATFDNSKIISIHGTVNSVEWKNPHARFLIDAKNEDGSVAAWELELPAPSALVRENIARDFLKPGDNVVLEVWRAKNGSMLAHVLTLTYPDGRVLTFPREWGAGMSAPR